jgi:hypothetical protein
MLRVEAMLLPAKSGVTVLATITYIVLVLTAHAEVDRTSLNSTTQHYSLSTFLSNSKDTHTLS